MPDTGHLNSFIPHALNSELLVFYFIYIFFFSRERLQRKQFSTIRWDVCIYVFMYRYVRTYFLSRIDVTSYIYVMYRPGGPYRE